MLQKITLNCTLSTYHFRCEIGSSTGKHWGRSCTSKDYLTMIYSWHKCVRNEEVLTSLGARVGPYEVSVRPTCVIARSGWWGGRRRGRWRTLRHVPTRPPTHEIAVGWKSFVIRARRVTFHPLSHLKHELRYNSAAFCAYSDVQQRRVITYGIKERRLRLQGGGALFTNHNKKK